MAERVYPSSKPSAQNLNGGGAFSNSGIPASKAQRFDGARPVYRPRPLPRRRRRSCCCTCCLWITFFVIILLVLAAAAGAIFWFLYRPQRPEFSVDSFRISQFTVTPSSQIKFKSNLTVTAQNPNKKIQFLYDPMILSVISKGVTIGSGAFPAFVHGAKNVTLLRAPISSSGHGAEGDASGNSLESDLKAKAGLALTVLLETKVGVKVQGVATKKVGIRIVCDGIKATAPAGKSPAKAIISGATCDVDLRVKIWKWSL